MHTKESSHDETNKLHSTEEWYKQMLQAGIFLFKAINGKTKTISELCSNLHIKTPEGRQWRGPGVFMTNFELISHIILVFSVLTLNK